MIRRLLVPRNQTYENWQRPRLPPGQGSPCAASEAPPLRLLRLGGARAAPSPSSPSSPRRAPRPGAARNWQPGARRAEWGGGSSGPALGQAERRAEAEGRWGRKFPFPGGPQQAAALQCEAGRAGGGGRGSRLLARPRRRDLAGAARLPAPESSPARTRGHLSGAGGAPRRSARAAPGRGMRLLWGLGALLACLGSAEPHAKKAGAAPGERGRRAQGTDGEAWHWRDERTCHWSIMPRILQGNQSLSLEVAALGRNGFPAQLQIALEVEGDHLLLDLAQNWELLAGAQGLAYYLPDGTRAMHQTSQEGNCCYRGSIQGLPESWANICICSGLSGLLVVSRSRSYSFESHVKGDTMDHTAYRLHSVRSSTGECTPVSLSHGQHQQMEPPLLHRNKRQAEPEHAYVELVMVADHAEFVLDPDLDRIRIRMLEIASHMDGFYRPLGLRVALVGCEVWNQRDQVPMDGPAHAVLERFLRWRQQVLLPKVPHDSVQLITGFPFTRGATGTSTHASICSGRSGGLSLDHSVSPLVMASTVSHQLGHNLGLSHDGSDCGCDGSSPNLPPGRSCIMEPPSGLMPGLSFSRCSHQQLKQILQSSRVWCLWDVPEPTRLNKSRCGNRLVELGEECDCGLREECTDPCCNAATCKLVPGAQCATGGACCHKCKLRGPGFVCRSSQNECDLPEFCNGVSPRCPTNVHKMDGTPCGEGKAICYGGACPTYMEQCQEVWGPDSVPVSDACMASLNGRGDLEGHCGQLPNGSYIPCAQRNARCGRLQCHGGSANITKQDKIGVSPACPHNTPPPANDILDLAMVLPGTACGPDKFCIDQRCQDLPALKFPVCLCNGHGVCNNNGNCHCLSGWTPPDCQSRGQGGSIDSGSPAMERGSATSTAVILSSLFLVLLLALGLFCAKRVGLHKRLCQFGKGTSCQYRTEAESRVQFLHPSERRGITQPEPRSYSRPPPQRPQSPQWRQSTELQLMPSSKPTPLGDTRPDPPSKPLPPDPIPKSQQAVAMDRPAPPTRPLPADPIPKAAQPPGPAKPPPPRKPLPSDPPRTEPSAIPSYNPQILTLPARPAPPPPPTSAGLPAHVQEV
ncbi:disintegrin and metalloproteinase domain-containing protein 15 [Eublepharis macularius]|uniref:Disintegrin and metalloproteinase domain-containing protein 15 n=1 Tax=Eublepharis macularius TaxID=481883 RepID=A0AA97KRL7_EUBMA|nr:disintegrin and metalloproteinase domain-containing protein 15 [Eublepharis macularius]